LVDIRGLKDPFTHIAAKIESEKIGPFGYMTLMELMELGVGVVLPSFALGRSVFFGSLNCFGLFWSVFFGT